MTTTMEASSHMYVLSLCLCTGVSYLSLSCSDSGSVDSDSIICVLTPRLCGMWALNP